MPLSTAQKQDIIKKFQTADGDTGSPEVQIALLSNRVEKLTDHSSSIFMTLIQDEDFINDCKEEDINF